MRFHFILLCSFFFVRPACSQTMRPDTALSRQMESEWSYATGFSQALSFNPAAAPFSEQPSLSHLGVSGVKKEGNAGLRQLGTGGEAFRLKANSFTYRSRQAIWGNASYEKGNKQKVRGNETSDFLLVYPYAMMDSLGGNHALSYEEYRFSGGYAKNGRKGSWGVELDYRALMEYGTRDPRPDNICSDLLFKAGALYPVAGHYALGGSIRLRKYKQKNNLKFYNPLGSTMVYHATGLGMNAYLFAGNQTRTRYDGGSYGGAIQFLPVDGNGFSASLAYDRFRVEKILPDFQNLPISRLTEGAYQVELSWKVKRKSYTTGIKTEFVYADRGGIEDKFHLPQYGNYVKIAEEKLFRNQTVSGKLAFLYEHRKKAPFTWQVLPYLSMFSLEEVYKVPLRRMKAIGLKAGSEGRLSVPVKRSSYYVQFGMGYRRTVDSELLLTDIQDSFVSRILQENFDYLSSDGFDYALSVQWNYPVTHRLVAYIKGAWSHQDFNPLYSNHLMLELGLVF